MNSTVRKKELTIIFGTRPEAIKLAPVIRKIEEEDYFTSRIILTGQHREMLKQMLDNFSLTPNINLNLMRKEQSLNGLTSRAVEKLGEAVEEQGPDMIVVHGDTTSTLTGALTAYYRQVPVAHVEAGLRSYDKYSPFPEEMNRRMTDVLADLHFAPTSKNKENLLQENVRENNIYITGNTVIDAALMTVSDNFTFASPLEDILKEAGNGFKKDIILLTAHRRENLGEDMEEIFEAVKRITEQFKDHKIIFPVHLNPAVRRAAGEKLGELTNVHLIEPLNYDNFINLMARSKLVLTDSGGIQEEAPAFDVPVVLLREKTERPEAIEAGTVVKAGTSKEEIVRVTERFLQDEDFYSRTAATPNPYGDGRAGERIVSCLLSYFGCSEERVEEFQI